MSKSNKSEWAVMVLDLKVAEKLVAVFSQEEFNAEVRLRISDSDSFFHYVFIKGESRLFNKIREIANKYAIWMRVDGVDADDQSPWEAVFPELCSYTVCCPDEESAQKMESELKELSIRLPEPSDQDDEYERLIREKLGVLDVNMWWSSEDKDITLDADTRVLNEIKKLSTKLSMKVEVEGHPKDLSYDEAKEEGLFVEFNFPEDPSPEELKAEWLKK